MSGIEDSHRNDSDFRPSVSAFSFLFKRSGLLAIIVIIIVLGGALYTQVFVRVPAGYRGVLLTWGKPEDRVLDEGLNFIIPFVQEFELMNVQIQKAESTESAAINDIQEVSTTIVVNFRLSPSSVNEVCRELRQDYVSRVIKPNIEESIKAATALYTAARA